MASKYSNGLYRVKGEPYLALVSAPHGRKWVLDDCDLGHKWFALPLPNPQDKSLLIPLELAL